MRIIDLLSTDRIALGAQISDKEQAIDKLVELQMAGGCIADREAYRKAILAREEMSSTAIEQGIAVPHAKSDAVSAPSLAAMTLTQGVDYGAMDGQPSDLFFMIAAPLNGDLHLEILSRLMVLLMDGEFVKALRSAADAQQFMAVIDRFEKEKYPQEVGGTEQKPVEEKAGYRVLAVTACPTGIAHTYMAAEALEKAAAQMNLSIKVETNGSAGVKNRLTAQEIEQADGIIVAADKNVETARFAGKKVLFVPVSDGIHKPQQLLEQIESGTVAVYEKEKKAAVQQQEQGKESFGRQLYKHLMNGVSHMLPFVIGGGILIAIAFLLDDYSINPANFGMNTPLAAFFKTVGGVAFDFMLPIPVSYTHLYLKQGKDILHLALTSAVSGSCNSAMMAARELKEEFPERTITVIDTLVGTLAQGMLVERAVRMKKAGKTLEQAAQWIRDAVPHTCLYATVDDLKHLYRGGRVSKTSAFLGSAIGIKPILKLNETGNLVPCAKVRGRKQSIQTLVKQIDVYKRQPLR